MIQNSLLKSRFPKIQCIDHRVLAAFVYLQNTVKSVVPLASALSSNIYLAEEIIFIWFNKKMNICPGKTQYIIFQIQHYKYKFTIYKKSNDF